MYNLLVLYILIHIFDNNSILFLILFTITIYHLSQSYINNRIYILESKSVIYTKKDKNKKFTLITYIYICYMLYIYIYIYIYILYIYVIPVM